MNKIERLFRQATTRYDLLADGDRILVGLSGGKDSMAMLELMAQRARIFRPHIEVEAAFVRMTNIPYKNDENYLRAFAEKLGMRLHVCETSFNPGTDHRHTPCFLCSWQRRKMLFQTAKALRCNKIALGHHRDDFIQTALLNLSFQGSFTTMRPMMQMDKFDMTLIRPLCLMRENDLQQWATEHSYRQPVARCPYENDSHRYQMKSIISQLEQMNPEFAHSFFTAIEKTWR